MDKKKKILIVDDDVDLVNAAKIILEANNFDVSTSGSDEHIKELVLNEKPDLIVLDVMFPENATLGFEMCRELKEDSSTKDIPVIILSAINQKFNMAFTCNVKESSSIPAECFLEKPINPKKFIKLINDLLSKKS